MTFPLPSRWIREHADSQANFDKISKEWPDQGTSIIHQARSMGEQAAVIGYGAGINQLVHKDSGLADWLEFIYTPPINVWCQVHCNIGQFVANTAAWQYVELMIYNVVGAVPAVTGFHNGRAAGTSDPPLGVQIVTIHSSLPYGALNVTCVFPLNAGVAYTIRPVINYQASTDRYASAEYNYMETIVWPRQQR